MFDKRGNRPINESLITALAIGGFFIVLALTIISIPNFAERINSFFIDLKAVPYPVSGSSSTINLPAPSNPKDHIAIFTAAMNFAIGIGVLQIVILGLRLSVKSPIRRIAETVGNLLFWFGAAAAASVYLLAATQTGWFQFWSWLIILAGLSLIAQFIIFFISSRKTA